MLCVRFDFQPRLSRADLDMLKDNIRQHLANSQQWLAVYFRERTRLAECSGPADSKIADIVLPPRQD